MLKINYFPKTKIFYMENETTEEIDIIKKISNIVIKKKEIIFISHIYYNCNIINNNFCELLSKKSK